MDPLANPFSPGAGSPPPELAGRATLLDDARIALGRVRAGRTEQSMMLVGLRGVGKTVLLNRIKDEADTQGYEVAMIEATEDKTLPQMLAPELRRILFRLDTGEKIWQATKHAMRVFRSFFGRVKLSYGELELGIDVDPEKGTADSGDLEADLAQLLIAIGEAAREKGTSVAIIVDEIQYLSENEMSALIMAAHQMSQRVLPVIIIGGGLPQLVGLAGKSKSYAERLFRYPQVGELREDDAIEALRDPVRRLGVDFTDEALGKILFVTKGYPYFLQEWGYQAWNVAKETPITVDVVDTATARAIQKLDESFFRVRFDRLTPREKDYMRALAELGDGSHRSGDIAECLGVLAPSIAPMRSGLIKKGMIYSPAHGDTAFTVPMFDDFMRRTLPNWDPKRK